MKNHASLKKVKKEWQEIKQKYPKFAATFIQSNAELSWLIQKTKAEDLKELIGGYIERSCALGLLPKCNAIPECQEIWDECRKIDILENPNAYGECFGRHLDCIRKFRLCCE
jgi:hypothetical protein